MSLGTGAGMGVSTRLLQLTDLHLFESPDARLRDVCTEASFARAVERALSEGPRPDGFLLTGDLTQDGSHEAYTRLARRLEPYGLPAWCIPGNHDDPEVMRAALPPPLFHHARYADFGPWRLLFLSTWDGDRGGGRLRQEELDAARDTLALPSPAHLAVVLHHHPVSIDSWLDKSAALDNPEDFWALIRDRADLRLVVFGHVHQVVDQQVNGARVLGTPSTCFQFTPATELFALDDLPPGWRWLELHDDGTVGTEVGWLEGEPDG